MPIWFYPQFILFAASLVDKALKIDKSLSRVYKDIGFTLRHPLAALHFFETLLEGGIYLLDDFRAYAKKRSLSVSGLAKIEIKPSIQIVWNPQQSTKS